LRSAVPHDEALIGEAITGASIRLPALILRESVLDHNIKTFATYVAREPDLVLAPHGKTTLCPAIFARQLQAGAWGITVASVGQAEIACLAGAPRVLIANEVVDSSELERIRSLEETYKSEIFFLVDSLKGARLANRVAERNHTSVSEAPGKFKVLLELGVIGGRTGVRTTEAAIELARDVNQLDYLELHGVEGYEGVIGHSRDPEILSRVDAYLNKLSNLAKDLSASGLLEPWNGHYLISAGGSRYFDRVTEVLTRPLGKSIALPFTVILRSGCYVIHDNGIYQATSPLDDQSAMPGEQLRLHPAGQVWCEIVSVPEPGLAIVNAGRRDISFDAGMPTPLYIAPPGGEVSAAPPDWAITKLDDQHGYLRAQECTIGMRVGLGFSHPCTAFDKWSQILLVDDNYRITAVVPTGFGGALTGSPESE